MEAARCTPRMMSHGYCIVIGATWYPAVDWKRANPGKPFVGLRLDRDDGSVRVVCERVNAGKELERSAVKAIEEMLRREGVNVARQYVSRRKRCAPQIVVRWVYTPSAGAASASKSPGAK